MNRCGAWTAYSYWSGEQCRTPEVASGRRPDKPHGILPIFRPCYLIICIEGIPEMRATTFRIGWCSIQWVVQICRTCPRRLAFDCRRGIVTMNVLRPLTTKMIFALALVA